jgi:photosystem II stability/assembly factor-like uncharacterized protein
MKIDYFKYISAFLFVACFCNALPAQTIEGVQQNNKTSIRGLSVVDDHIAWASGSKGHVGITNDGGQTWAWQQVKGFEASDFRNIEAFSGKEAVIMSSGTPALILKTSDGGSSWQVKYRSNDTAYFFDAMDFDAHNHGYVLGDPINGKFVLMETTDGGETWTASRNPPNALPGEAAFAASGTCLRLTKGNVIIASGGSFSRMIVLPKHKNAWEYWDVPITHGKASEGAFSVATGKNERLLVGGDYAHDKRPDSTAVINELKNPKHFVAPQKGPAGFQSCVEYISGTTYLSTGTSGSYITTNSGQTWTKINDASYNVCRKARRGKLVLLAGDKGKTGILKL